MNGLDSQFFQFLNRTGMDSGYIADVVIWERGIAAVVELARDRIGAMGTHWYWRRLRKSQYSKFRPEQESELRLEPRDSPRQVSDLEEPTHINGAALKHIVSIDVGEARGSQVEPAARNDAVLNRHVIQMVLFEVCRGLDLDQTPSLVSPTLQDIHPYKHTTVFKRSFEDGRNPGICDQLPGDTNRLLWVSPLDFHAARKKLVSQQPHLLPLIHNRFA